MAGSHAYLTAHATALLAFDISDPVVFLGLTLACLAVILIAILALVRSSFGRSLKAIRDDETAASAYLFDVTTDLTEVFVVSTLEREADGRV